MFTDVNPLQKKNCKNHFSCSNCGFDLWFIIFIANHNKLWSFSINLSYQYAKDIFSFFFYKLLVGTMYMQRMLAYVNHFKLSTKYIILKFKLFKRGLKKFQKPPWSCLGMTPKKKLTISYILLLRSAECFKIKTDV